MAILVAFGDIARLTEHCVGVADKHHSPQKFKYYYLNNDTSCYVSFLAECWVASSKNEEQLAKDHSPIHYC